MHYNDDEKLNRLQDGWIKLLRFFFVLSFSFFFSAPNMVSTHQL